MNSVEVIQFVYISPTGSIANSGEPIQGATYSQGFMRYVVMKETDDYEPYVEIRQIFINEDARLKGYGSKFVNFLVKLAKKEKLEAIYVATTALDTDPFGQFMVRMGFERPFDITNKEIFLPQNLPHFPFRKLIKKRTWTKKQK